MTQTIQVEKREDSVSNESIRAAGNVPAVVYGPKQEPVSLIVSKQLFEKTLREAGESTILTLEGIGEEVEVLIQDVAFDAARGGVSHVDFYAIERGKELTTNVPLEFVGEAPVEKQGATVNKVVHDIEVTCRPSKLPANIPVDLSVLTAEDSQITVGDLSVPEEVKLSLGSEEVIVTVAAARAEEEEMSAEAPDMDAIEVESKGKGEEAAAE